jgi:hypothetical protein
MFEVKSEKMVKYFFPKSFLDDLGVVYALKSFISKLNSEDINMALPRPPCSVPYRWPPSASLQENLYF